MSATKPQEEALPFDNEPITAGTLETLQYFAEKSGINLDEASQQKFGMPVRQLTRGQGNTLLVTLGEALAKQRALRHRHYCVECGDTVGCLTPGCTETEDLCYRCRKGDYQPSPPKRFEYKPRPKPFIVLKLKRR